jgi:cytoskeletal protein CcmA (bactofilin family)
MFKLSNKETIKDTNEVIKNVNKKTSIPSIINAEMEIKGDMKSDNIIEVFGKVHGNIVADVVSIREGASIEGKIIAKYVKIAGNFTGEIKSSILHITSTGNAHAKLTYGIISIEEKAKFDGTMTQEAELLTIKQVEALDSAVEKSDTEVSNKKKKIENEQ